ncbi:MAG: DUF898 family protein [Pseudolabrys sp.]|jgi:uncharacterized membrane protein YjgN (DUF898 family)
MASLDAGGIVTSGGVRFLGQRRSYWRLLIRGAALLMVTLGIYRFWLVTDVRRFLWSNTEIAGEPLEYTGTALELLIGFLVAIALLIPIYAGFFLAALDLGLLGKLSGLLAFAALGVLGQYAIYRARRYRLTRTIYRGLRFHQSGSAWSYAIRATLWWIATIVTLGLAYPFQMASLERYKMRNTFYGDLAGRFEASGFALLLRGLPMWLLFFAPLALAIRGFVGIDWQALIDAIAQGGDDVMSKIEGGNPGLGSAIVFAMLMGGTSIVLGALLYPAFQALILRWWSSGLRFGGLEVRSRLRTRDVYGAYARFVGYASLFSIAMGIIGTIVLFMAGAVVGAALDTAEQITATLLLLVAYVITALGFSTIYRATVQLSLWQLGMESLELSGLSELEKVKAAGRPSSALGEGLADALNVGGY